MGWLMLTSVKPISSTEMSRYRYSGHNSFGKDIPKVLQVDPLLQEIGETLFPCKVFDASGKLKYIISKEEILQKNIKKYREAW